MTTFFDTSVLIAAFQTNHIHHALSNRAMVEAFSGEVSCGVHSLAEFYSVTTRISGALRVDPAHSFLFIQDLVERLNVVGLSPSEYFEALQQAAGRDIPGGRIYDFLLLACARKSSAERIVT